MDYSVKHLVLDLARAREEKEYSKGKIERLQAEIALTSLGEQLQSAMDRLAAVEETVTAADSALRGAALDSYHQTHVKKVHEAITVKIYTVLEYDEAAAITEAIEHFKWTLKIDKRKFNAIARDADFTFVTKRVDPRVFVARDLSPYLEAWQNQIDLTEAADLIEGKAESDFVADLFEDDSHSRATST